MQENTSMEINRETAMRLWAKAFGKCNKATDFAGREMVKAAYDDRNSEFGWNIDHVLPQSRGGRTNDSNLVCCHISSNDEKADSFPCFWANGKKFEIVKVQNHYEIKNSEQKADFIDFFDSAAGVRYFKHLKAKCIHNKEIFVGIVTVRLYGLLNTAVVDFITRIFSGRAISYTWDDNAFVVRITDYCMPDKEDTVQLLNDCILLNTYLGSYIVPTNEINSYNIFYGLHYSSDKLDGITDDNDFADATRDSLVINELVKNNTKAYKKLKDVSNLGVDQLGYHVYEYNMVYTLLKENLKNIIK